MPRTVAVDITGGEKGGQGQHVTEQAEDSELLLHFL